MKTVDYFKGMTHGTTRHTVIGRCGTCNAYGVDVMIHEGYSFQPKAERAKVKPYIVFADLGRYFSIWSAYEVMTTDPKTAKKNGIIVYRYKTKAAANKKANELNNAAMIQRRLA